jgi:hypothetical protein
LTTEKFQRGECKFGYQAVIRVVIIHCSQGVVSFTLEELKGVAEDVISGYAKRTEDGIELYDVTHKTPDIFPVVRK